MKDINQTRKDLVSVIIPYYKKKKIHQKSDKLSSGTEL